MAKPYFADAADAIRGIFVKVLFDKSNTFFVKYYFVVPLR